MRVLQYNVHEEDQTEKNNKGKRSQIAGMFLRYLQSKNEWQRFEISLMACTKSVLGATQLNFLTRVPTSFVAQCNEKMSEYADVFVWNSFRHFFESGNGKKMLKALVNHKPQQLNSFWRKLVIFLQCFSSTA
jgi:hypothetical protein